MSTKKVTCCASFEEEFQCDKVWYTHDRPLDFIRSQWNCIGPSIYTCYRTSIALAQIGWLIFDFYHNFDGKRPFWLLYATNWSFLIYVIANLSLSVACLKYNCVTGYSNEVKGYKVLWILYSLSTTNIIITSMGYWTALFNSDLAMQDMNLQDTVSKAKHSINAGLVVVDLLISAIPVRLAHAVYLIVMVGLYSIFSFIYYVAGGKGPTGNGYIYPQLHWNNAGLSVVIIFISLLFIMLAKFFIFLLYRVRISLATQCGANYAGYETVG